MKIHKSVKIEESLLDALQKLANAENRSVNNYIETVLMAHLYVKKSGVVDKSFKIGDSFYQLLNTKTQEILK